MIRPIVSILKRSVIILLLIIVLWCIIGDYVLIGFIIGDYVDVEYRHWHGVC